MLLAFLALTGLLMPLSQLTAHSDVSKATFLAMASAGITGLLTFIGWQLYELRASLSVHPDDLDLPDM